MDLRLEEILGVFGWFSNPNLVDTDADGVSVDEFCFRP